MFCTPLPAATSIRWMHRPFQLDLSRETILKWLLAVLMLVLLIREFVWTPTLITGKSMLPTLQGGQFAGINKLAYCRHPPQRGDIVAAWTGKNLIIKRIIGLPGEEILVSNGTFFVNGKVLQESYVQHQDHWNIGVGRVNADQFVIAGDNRPETLLAVLSRQRIVGRLIRGRQGWTKNFDGLAPAPRGR
jgi:signal peptidase I